MPNLTGAYLIESDSEDSDYVPSDDDGDLADGSMGGGAELAEGRGDDALQVPASAKIRISRRLVQRALAKAEKEKEIVDKPLNEAQVIPDDDINSDPELESEKAELEQQGYQEPDEYESSGVSDTEYDQDKQWGADIPEEEDSESAKSTDYEKSDSEEEVKSQEQEEFVMVDKDELIEGSESSQSTE